MLPYMQLHHEQHRVPDVLGYCSLLVHTTCKLKNNGYLLTHVYSYDQNYCRSMAVSVLGDKWVEVDVPWLLALMNTQTNKSIEKCNNDKKSTSTGQRATSW